MGNFALFKPTRHAFPKLGLVLTSALYLSSCTVNPTVFGIIDGKFEHDITFDIVKKVRCETRDAMVKLAIKLINLEIAKGDHTDIPGHTQEDMKQTVKMLSQYPGSVKNLKIWDVPVASQVLASLLINSNVKFAFDITVNESNANSITPKLTASHGVHKIDLAIAGQSLKGERENQRKFTIPATQFDIFQEIDCPRDYPFTTSFDDENFAPSERLTGSFYQRQKARLRKVQTEEQIKKLEGASKNGDKADRADYVYPLRGNIDLFKTIDAFVNYSHIGSVFQQRRGLAQLAFAEASYQALTGETKMPTPKQQSRYVNKALDYYPRLLKCGENASVHKRKQCRTDSACLELIHQRAGMLFANKLYALKSTPKVSDAAGTFTEILSFTTTIESGLEPTITFATPASLSLETLGFSFKPKRLDTHKLTSTFIARGVQEVPALFTKQTTKKIPVKLAVKDGFEIVVNLKKEIVEAANNTCIGSRALASVKDTSKAFASTPRSKAEEKAVKEKFEKVDAINRADANFRQLQLR